MKVLIKLTHGEFFKQRFGGEGNLLSFLSISGTSFIGEVSELELLEAVSEDVQLECVEVKVSLGLTGKMRINDVPVSIINPLEEEGLWLRATTPVES